MRSLRIDDKLPSWDKTEPRHEWKGILVGNGASRAVWDDFQYTSLYETSLSGGPYGKVNKYLRPYAEERGLWHSLTKTDQVIFESMKTQNFEQVLSALMTARTVCESLNIETATIQSCYKSVQNALIHAVKHVHIPHNLAKPMFENIRESLRMHSVIFSTNYDLIIYWAIMDG